ncbi:arrestin domain-containing protein 3 [Scaptodrosophila lebanonensis]|uniref:Arrestin domain-containing protein 3 n=1 Tax=Drosophila lebanonensis TaxID=7225 RepID=A0A6J2THS6_DROLE|nr:arrestin domain-containing protein 3 [Scaptodrosophila lebanonensis]XP_030374567.1 arrestin domain-containing protein 3 [Scaptodrosophila lebanonensis]
MSSKVTFAFDNNPLGVYYAGQVISGTAELITERPKTIRSIFITVNGFVETRWQEDVEKPGTDGKPIKIVETHTTTEIYYSSDKYVYGQSGGSPLELPKGKYVFPFQAAIPLNAPTSFNGMHGQIKHEVTLTIDRAVRYNNIFKQCFTVILPYDLNQQRENLQPQHRVEEKTFWWGSLFGGKPMIMDVSTSYSGYVPGQKIQFKILLDNQSEVQCQDVKVRLFKNVSYRANSGEEQLKKTEARIADKHCGEVLKHNKAEFKEFLIVPPTTPTTQSPHDPIKVSYTLRFIAKTFRLHGGGDLVVNFPIVIGTVPLIGTTDDQGLAVHTPLRPPIFQEDVNNEQFEANTFKPRYPVFFQNALLQNGEGNCATSNIPSLYPNVANASKLSLPNIGPNPIPAAAASNPPYPTKTNAPTATKMNTGNGDGAFEVLGFSIPPDYQPTASAPAAASSDIGWK